MDLTAAAHALDPAAYGHEHHPPRWALRPGSRAELLEVVKGAARDGLRMIPWGGAPSPSDRAGLPPYDLALDLSALNAIVEYESEDLTLTAECGVSLATLRATLAARGQSLPIEGARDATLGGALALNSSGPRRVRFGSPRDRVLGARFVLSDGTLARTGGKVVKNVAGFGIHRLMCGSRGGLGIVLEASLKLLPAPASRVALVWRQPPPLKVRDRTLAVALARLEPSIVWIEGPPRRATLTIGLEDDGPWVEQQIARVIEMFGAPDERLEDDAAVTRLDALGQATDLGSSNGDGAVPARLTTGERLLSATAILDTLAGVRTFSFDALAGRLNVELDRGEAVTSTHRLIEADFQISGGGSSRIESPVPDQVAVLALRRSIRQALDPARLMALGDHWERGAFS